MVVLVGQEVQALVDTASDLNLIQKDIADHLRLRPLFPARAATQADGVPLKTYSVFHERLQMKDSFGTHLDAQDPLTSANIEISLILGLPSLLNYNPIPNFDPMTIVRPLPMPELPVKSDGIYRATLWLRNSGHSRHLHN